VSGNRGGVGRRLHLELCVVVETDRVPEPIAVGLVDRDEAFVRVEQGLPHIGHQDVVVLSRIREQRADVIAGRQRHARDAEVDVLVLRHAPVPVRGNLASPRGRAHAIDEHDTAVPREFVVLVGSTSVVFEGGERSPYRLWVVSPETWPRRRSEGS
jgi:hypothetical protein